VTVVKGHAGYWSELVRAVHSNCIHVLSEVSQNDCHVYLYLDQNDHLENMDDTPKFAFPTGTVTRRQRFAQADFVHITSRFVSFAVLPTKNSVTSSRMDPVGRQQQIDSSEGPEVVGR